MSSFSSVWELYSSEIGFFTIYSNNFLLITFPIFAESLIFLRFWSLLISIGPSYIFTIKFSSLYRLLIRNFCYEFVTIGLLFVPNSKLVDKLFLSMLSMMTSGSKKNGLFEFILLFSLTSSYLASTFYLSFFTSMGRIGFYCCI